MLFHRSHTTLIVGASFAIVVVLGGLVTVATTRTIDRLQDSIATLSQTSQVLDDSIQALRSRIYVSAVMVRDSLLDASAQRRDSYATHLSEHQRSAMAEMERVARLSSPAHASTVKSLIRETNSYWESVTEALELPPDQRGSVSYEYIRTNIIPRRQAVMTVAEELADLQAAETAEAQRNLKAAIGAFRSRISGIRALAVGFVAVVALVCTWRVHTLEKVADQERVRRNQAEAELRQLAQKLVQAHEDERRSLSRELHDQVGQTITALRFRLGGIEAENTSPTPGFRRMIEECRSLLEGTIETIRHIAMGLRPAMLDDLGMNAAIEWHAREFSKRFDIPVTLRVAEAANQVPEPQRTYVYRIVQEALTNCARHSRATSVQIDLHCSNHHLELSIQDDGVGLTNRTKPSRGFGLTGIEERVRELHGAFAAYSPPEGGTVLNISMPLPGAVSDAKA